MNIYGTKGEIISPDWEHQICKCCGREQRLDYQVRDPLWTTIAQKYTHAILCIECFLKSADDANIVLKKDDIVFICAISKTGWSWNY